MARDVLPDSETLPTFSLTFDAVPESDEKDFIEAVHREGDYDPHFVAADQEGPLDTSLEAMEALGEPFNTPNLFLTTTLLHGAREAGTQVALDGFLGDSVTGHGTTRITELALTGRWFTAARELRAAAKQLGPSWGTYKRLFRQFVAGPLLMSPLQRAWEDLLSLPPGDDAARRVVQPGLLQSVDWDERARTFGADRERTPVRERAAHKQEVKSGNLGLAVETAVRMGRRFGVSLRFPFTDEDLISFCLALPPRQKCRDGWTRVIAREALADVLPEKITSRYGKASLGPVFNRAFFQLNRDRLHSIIHDKLDETRAFLRPDAVRKLYRRCIEGNASQDEIEILWNAVLFTQWITSRSVTDSVSAACRPRQAEMEPA
jgi:asparagine synthase (glutamine-hydrolysing)